jgi:hypothetical protein
MKGPSMSNYSKLIFVLYDGIEHSIFEGQVLAPLLKRLDKNKNLSITLVSFERHPLSQEIFSRLTTLHTRLSFTIIKRGPFLGTWSVWRNALSLRRLLTPLKQYQIIARGPLAGLITTKALTTNCTHYTLQARGLLAEEYRYAHNTAPRFLNWLYYLRAYQLEYWERKAYSCSIPTKFLIEVVSSALQDYLAEHYKGEQQFFSLAQLDAPKKINPAQRDNLRTSLRKELGINLSTHVYVYNGSAQSWQCPQKTVLFFKKQLKNNSDSFLLILTTDIKTFERLCKTHKLPSKVYTLLQVSHTAVLNYLCVADTGLLFREKHVINWVSRPTKYLEYKAANLFITHNKTIAALEQEG